MASTGIERKITNWNVSEKENFSDHNTINFSIMTDCRGQTDTYRNVRKTDWNLYRSLLEDRIDIPNENDSLDVHTEKLTNVITSSYFDSCRLTRTKKKTKPPWWLETTLGHRWFQIEKIETTVKPLWFHEKRKLSKISIKIVI